VFDKILKESCPYHRGPVKHTLEECDMLRRYFNKAGPSARMARTGATTRKEATEKKSSQKSTTAS
jgi:predicted anti-sigma-YlaC factor YlaD